MTFDPNRPTRNPGAPSPRPTDSAGRPQVPSFIPPSVAAAVAQPPKRSRVAGSTLGLVAALLVAAVGLGFAGGRITAPQAATRGGLANGGGFGPNASGGPGTGRTGGAGGFGGLTGDVAVTGAVTAIANGTITIQTTAGQSVTIDVPSTVTYHSETGTTASAVTVGTTVQLTVTRPNFRGPGASGAPGASAGTGTSANAMTATDVLVLSK